MSSADLTPRGTSDPGLPLRRLLAVLGTTMIGTGQPIDEIEDELAEVGEHLGAPDVQVAAFPTGLHVSLATGEPAAYQVVTGGLRLDQAADVRLIRHQLVTGEIGIDAALQRLLELPAKPSAYPNWLMDLGFLAVGIGICLIMQPALPNLIAAAVGGLVVMALTKIARRRPTLLALLPTVAGFAITVLVLTAVKLGLLEGPLRTVLPPLAVLLPGALIVTGLAELAAGAMIAGSSRLVYGTVQLLLFALGITAGVALLHTPPELLGNIRVDGFGPWAIPLGLLAIGLGIAVMESVPVRLLPWVIGVLVLTFLAQFGGQSAGAPVLGSFVGAVVASIGSYVAEMFDRRLPRLVVFLPSFWLLVPGSLGLLGVSEILVATSRGPTVGYEAAAVVLAIATGLMVGSVVTRTARRVGRTLRRVVLHH